MTIETCSQPMSVRHCLLACGHLHLPCHINRSGNMVPSRARFIALDSAAVVCLRFPHSNDKDLPCMRSIEIKLDLALLQARIQVACGVLLQNQPFELHCSGIELAEESNHIQTAT